MPQYFNNTIVFLHERSREKMFAKEKAGLCSARGDARHDLAVATFEKIFISENSRGPQGINISLVTHVGKLHRASRLIELNQVSMGNVHVSKHSPPAGDFPLIIRRLEKSRYRSRSNHKIRHMKHVYRFFCEYNCIFKIRMRRGTCSPMCYTAILRIELITLFRKFLESAYFRLPVWTTPGFIGKKFNLN